MSHHVIKAPTQNWRSMQVRFVLYLKVFYWTVHIRLYKKPRSLPNILFNQHLLRPLQLKISQIFKLLYLKKLLIADQEVLSNPEVILQLGINNF